MIRTDAEYNQAKTRLFDEKKRLREHEARIKDAGHTAEETKRLLDPLVSFHLQLEEEVSAYEKTQRGTFDHIVNLHGLGYLLIGARIYQGMSQRDLAEKLGIHESQVSRDERNEYRSITVARASRILDLLEVELTAEMRAGKSSAEPTESNPEG